MVDDAGHPGWVMDVDHFLRDPDPIFLATLAWNFNNEILS
jgi:hypothetical protein